MPAPMVEVLPVEWTDISPGKLLLLRYMLEGQLGAPGSISGHQVERLRVGLGGPPQGVRNDAVDRVRSELADALLLCRGLNELEERVCAQRYGASDGVSTYDAIRRLADLRDGDGEEIADTRPHALDGTPLDGYVAVRGVRARFPAYETIGKRLGLTPGQVRMHLDTARAKIAEAQKWRRLMQEQEAGAL